MVLETFEILGPFHLNLREGLLYFVFRANCMNGNNTFPCVVAIVYIARERQVQRWFYQLIRGGR